MTNSQIGYKQVLPNIKFRDGRLQKSGSYLVNEGVLKAENLHRKTSHNKKQIYFNKFFCKIEYKRVISKFYFNLQGCMHSHTPIQDVLNSSYISILMAFYQKSYWNKSNSYHMMSFYANFQPSMPFRFQDMNPFSNVVQKNVLFRPFRDHVDTPYYKHAWF